MLCNAEWYGSHTHIILSIILDVAGMFYEYFDMQLKIAERKGQTEGGMNDPDREPNNL